MKSLNEKLIVVCLWAGVIAVTTPVYAVDIPTDTSVGTWDSTNRIYTLTADVSGTVSIVEDNLTLDGNGRTVTGPGSWGGVRVASRSYITIKNLTATGFDQGIQVEESSHITLTGNITLYNDTGIGLWKCHDITIEDNVASYGDHGIFPHTCTQTTLRNNTIEHNTLGGIWIANCTDTTLAGNTVSYNNTGGDYLRAGIRVFDCQDSTLTGNTIIGNGGQGIRIHTASGNIVENNLVSQNSESGIRIGTGSHDNQIRYNTCTFNGSHGIHIVGYPDTDSLRYTTVTGNTASDNVEHGILFFSCGDNLITGNTCERNGGTGIEVGKTANTTVSDNTALHNHAGISVWVALGTSMRNNIASNGVCGMAVHECEDVTVADNTISSNTGVGIELAGRVDGALTGNTISYNGTGIKLIGCQDSTIYNNNFVENATQATGTGTDNLFNLEKPIGGNFWSDWTGPDEDGDGFVDIPYVFDGGQDDLPWANQGGWHITTASTYLPLGGESNHSYHGIPFAAMVGILDVHHNPEYMNEDGDTIPARINLVDTWDLSNHGIARKLHILQHCSWATNVPTGTTVGRIEVFYSDGSSSGVDLVIGVNTAEWAWENADGLPCLQHKGVEPGFSWFVTEDWNGRHYYVSIPLEGKPLAYLTLTLDPQPYTNEEWSYGCCPWNWFGIVVTSITIEYPSPIAATLALEPETLNLWSGVKWISAYMSLPGGFDLEGKDLHSVQLNGQSRAFEWFLDEDLQVLIIRFARSDMDDILQVGEVPITVTGTLGAGATAIRFQGTDVIKVIDPGSPPGQGE